MEHINSIVIEGNMVRDPELRIAKSGGKYCRFSIASNRNVRNGDKFDTDVSFIDMMAWGKAAETLASSCKKGSGLRVVGKLRQERWENAEGKKCSKIVVIADHIEPKSSMSERHQAALAQKSQEPLAVLAQDDISIEDEPFALQTGKEEAVF